MYAHIKHTLVWHQVYLILRCDSITKTLKIKKTLLTLLALLILRQFATVDTLQNKDPFRVSSVKWGQGKLPLIYDSCKSSIANLDSWMSTKSAKTQTRTKHFHRVTQLRWQYLLQSKYKAYLQTFLLTCQMWSVLSFDTKQIGQMDTQAVCTIKHNAIYSTVCTDFFGQDFRRIVKLCCSKKETFSVLEIYQRTNNCTRMQYALNVALSPPPLLCWPRGGC